MGSCLLQPGLELGTGGSVLNGREKRVLHQQAGLWGPRHGGRVLAVSSGGGPVGSTP